jgi:hypothetical protein
MASSTVNPANPRISAPAAKALLPDPVIMAPRISGLASISSAASPSSWMTVLFKALSFSGRLMVMIKI